MKKKEDLRVIKTKKSIYEGLLQLMKDKSFEEIKVSEICQAAIVNRSTFYDHFNDKYELLATLIQDLEEELVEKLNEKRTFSTIKEYYMSMIETLFQHISKNISIYSSIIKTNNNGIASDMFRDAMLADVENRLESFVQTSMEIPVGIVSIFYVSAVINVCIEYVKQPNKYSMEEILHYLDQLIPDNIYANQNI